MYDRELIETKKKVDKILARRTIEYQLGYADAIDEFVIAYMNDEEQYDGCIGCGRFDDYCCIQCFRDRFLEQLKEHKQCLKI